MRVHSYLHLARSGIGNCIWRCGETLCRSASDSGPYSHAARLPCSRFLRRNEQFGFKYCPTVRTCLAIGAESEQAGECWGGLNVIYVHDLLADTQGALANWSRVREHLMSILAKRTLVQGLTFHITAMWQAGGISRPLPRHNRESPAATPSFKSPAPRFVVV